MILTTFNGKPAWLFNAPTSEPVSITISIPSTHQVGLTNREARQTDASGPHRTFEMRCRLTRAEALAIEAALDAWRNEPVLVPLWPFARLAAAPDISTYSGRIRIWWNGETIAPGAFEVVQNVTPPTAPTSLSVNALTATAPVALCQIDSMPDMSKPTPSPIDGSFDYTFSFRQIGGSEFDLVRRSVALTNGPSVHGQAVPVWSGESIEWSERKMGRKVRIERKAVTDCRDTLDTFYPHQPREVHSVSGTLVGCDEAAYLVGLFETRLASVRPFYLSAAMDIGDLVYGRFSEDSISLTWNHGGFGGEEVVAYSFDFETLPNEEVLPVGEVYGQTIGPINGDGLVWGIVATTTSQAWRYVIGDDAVAGPGGTFQPCKLEPGEFTEEEHLKLSDFQFRMDGRISNPFWKRLYVPGLEPVKIQLYEWVRGNAAGAKILYTGWMASCNPSGPALTVDCVPGNEWLMSKGPRQVVGTGCYKTFGDSECKASTAGSTRTAESSSGSLVTFSSSGFSNGDLARGWAERTASDGEKQRFYIDGNTTTAGKLTVSVRGEIVPSAAAGEQWKLVKVCNNTIDSCRAFGNEGRFGGFWSLPETAPAARIQPDATGKK